MIRVLKTLILAAIFVAVSTAQGMVYFTNSFASAYNFAGQTNASLLTVNVSQPTFTLEGDLAKVGVSSSSAADRFMASEWSTNSFDSTKFFEFTLKTAAAPGIPFAYLDTLQIDFALRRSSSGPRQFQWRSSLDNFATAITNFSTLNGSVLLAGGVITLPDTASTETFGGNAFTLGNLPPLSMTNLSLRLYAYQAESVFGQAGLDTPLGFSGDVVVPEPSTLALLGLSALAGAWWKLRRRR
jgi:hypothetical protein